MGFVWDLGFGVWVFVSSLSDRRKQTSNLLIDLVWTRNRVRDLAAQKLAQTTPHSVQRHPDGALVHSQAAGGFLIEFWAKVAGQAGLQLLEQLSFAAAI